MSHQETLHQLARAAQNHSYSPYSKFKVGAALVTTSGKTFSGANIENASYGLTICAEAVAIAQMIMAGEKEIAEIVTIGSSNEPCVPCGACRQRIAEFAKKSAKIHVYSQDRFYKSFALADLLPESFSSENFVI